jgi:chlorite dismutase
MSLTTTPRPTFVRFGSALPPPNFETSLVDHYRIEVVRSIVGTPIVSMEAGQELLRIESTQGAPPGAGDLVGVTQHAQYQNSAEAAELATRARPAPSSVSVIIPISKSADWWALGHAERAKLFRSEGTRGHIHVGRPHVKSIHRKLYHARYLPNARWDFITYFEFEADRTDDFRALVAGLRDTKRNPEWTFVERESEIWLKKIA